MVWRIRQITEEQYEAFYRLVNDAFQGLHAENWLRSHIEQTPTEALYGMFESDKLVAGMRTFQFEMNFSSTAICAGELGMLAVDMLHKKEKKAYHLLQYFFRLNEESKTYMVMLHPFRVSFYKKMGFGIGTKVYQYSINPVAFVDFKEKSHLIELTEEYREQIMNCYNRIYTQTHGMIKRNAFERELNRPFLFGRVIGYMKNDRLRGYFVYSIEKNVLYIHEQHFETADVMKEFSTFYNSQSDQIKKIVIHSNHDDLLYFLQSPESGKKSMVDFASDVDHSHVADVGMGVMYRIINCAAFFRDLKGKNHSFNHETMTIKLIIRDDFYSENQKPVIVEFNDGRIERIREEGSFDVILTMNIAEFSSLIIGAENFSSFYKWGLAELSDERYLHKINSLFLTPSEPVMTKAF